MAETIKLDPSAVATSRTEVDISSFIAAEGPDWGDAQIEAYMAQGERGDTPVDYRIPNRTVVIPLRLVARGATSFETIRRNLQAKVSLFQREGGWLSRTTSVGTLYGDIVNATLRLGGDWLQAQKSIDVNAVLTLELVPDWYGAEVSLDDKTETTLPTYVKVMQVSSVDAVIAGDYPGRVRIVVDDDDNETRHGLLWGWRSRHYSSATTAALFYQAEALTKMDATAAGTPIVGESGSVVTHASLGTNWTPILSTQATGGGAHMTHTGTYRVWVRAYVNNPAPSAQLRFVWDVGDLTNPTFNAPATVSSDGFQLCDLGEIRLDSVPVGSHRWQGQIQGRWTAVGTSVSVDTLEFQPIDDGGGRLVTAVNAEPGLAAYVARDNFTQTAGALTGKTAAVGGVWLGAGDADDFAVDATNDLITRTAVSDTTLATGRMMVPTATGITAQVVQADFKVSATPTGSSAYFGVLARYADSSNYLFAGIAWDGAVWEALVVQRIAAVSGVYAPVTYSGFTLDTWYTVRFATDTDGSYWLWVGTSAEALSLYKYGTISGAATGGALASGKPGIIDAYMGAGATTRSYKNFAAWPFASDAVLYAQQSAELRTDGIFREDAAGAAYGPLIPQSGGLPRIPVSGLESRKVELYLRATRGDFADLTDGGTPDDISARAHYRPSWLTAPGS